MHHKPSKYGRKDTPIELEKQWEESQKDMKMAKSGESWERLIALQKFKESFAQKKRQITLKNLKDPYY
jgi:hypothetical protein